MIKQRQNGRFPLLNNARISEDYTDKLIVPYTFAPVLVAENDVIEMIPMKFSLVPSWSPEPKVKFATHNARLESVDQKKTWKNPFIRRHCIVPMTDFIEPIYEGAHAGNMVSFHAPENQGLLAAGIWDEWADRKSGEVMASFAIITHDPLPFVEKQGHDRSPLFLQQEDAETWLTNTGEDEQELKRFLLEARNVPELEIENFRPMRPGWEKRK